MLKDALLSTFVQVILPLLGTGLVSVLTWVVAQLGRRAGLAAKTSELALVAEKAMHFAQVVVAELDATLKPKLVEMTKDGVLTPAEIAQLRNMALERLKDLLCQRGMNELQQVLGLVGPQLDNYLRGLLERAVDLKNAAAPAKLTSASLVQTSATVAEVFASPSAPDSP